MIGKTSPDRRVDKKTNKLVYGVPSNPDRIMKYIKNNPPWRVVLVNKIYLLVLFHLSVTAAATAA